MEYDILIGIDPDVERNGVATLNVASKELDIKALSFAATLDYIDFYVARAKVVSYRVAVVMEAGWLNSSNWHLDYRHTNEYSAAIGNAVGRNHATGIHLTEMLRHKGITVILRKPLKKFWRGKDRKITKQELASITGYEKRTNQEGRDAALLAWVEAYKTIDTRQTQKLT